MSLYLCVHILAVEGMLYSMLPIRLLCSVGIGAENVRILRTYRLPTL